jgi:hypothetical protein
MAFFAPNNSKHSPKKDLADSPLFRFPWEALFLGMIPDKFLDSW